MNHNRMRAPQFRMRSPRHSSRTRVEIHIPLASRRKFLIAIQGMLEDSSLDNAERVGLEQALYLLQQEEQH